jgi:hypothetical protein
LVIDIWLIVHLFLVNKVVAVLSPYCNLPSYTSGLPPFGQVNFHTADWIALVEWLVVVFVSIVFAVALLREKTE